MNPLRARVGGSERNRAFGQLHQAVFFTVAFENQKRGPEYSPQETRGLARSSVVTDQGEKKKNKNKKRGIKRRDTQTQLAGWTTGRGE